MSRAWVLVALLSLAGCSRCGGAAAARDAGPESQRRKNADARSALIFVYPEYRGTAVLDATVRLERVMPSLDDAAFAAEAQRLHWQPQPDGGLGLSGLQVARLAPDTVEISLPYPPEQLGQLYTSYNALTSGELAYYLPRVPASRERFRFEVHYVTSPSRARDLVAQAVRLLRGSPLWSLDGGAPTQADAGEAPHEETFVVQGPEGARVTLERSGGKVFARYELVTLGE